MKRASIVLLVAVLAVASGCTLKSLFGGASKTEQTAEVAVLLWQGELASAPADPRQDWAYFDLGRGEAYVWDGGAWKTLGEEMAKGLLGRK